MLTTIQQLREIAICCQSNQHLRPELARWLGARIELFLHHRVASLEAALGLRWSRGGVPWWKEEAIRNRDRALRLLAMVHFPGLSVGQQVRHIHARAVRYASTAWRLEQGLADPPGGDPGALAAQMWLAFKSGAPMPISERRLRDILRSD